ncbi:antiterminator Q family protein, partial [Salmonella enterica]
MRNIQQVLERWGGWAADSNTAVSWAPVAAG